jgi:hypothetical protein
MPVLASPKTPQLHCHKAAGQGYVRLDGQFKYLGRYDDPATQQRYHRLVAEWIAGGNQHPADPQEITIEELMVAYTAHAQEFYRKPDGRQTSEFTNNHDDRYYTRVQIDGLIAGKAACRHTALSHESLDRVCSGPVLQSGLATARHLNTRGIDPYVALSGIVPPSMCEADGKTLADVEDYCVMATGFAVWLRKSGVRFKLFGPQYETDLGPPEGPLVGPAGHVALCQAMARHFDAAGLSDVKFVVAEQGRFNHEPRLPRSVQQLPRSSGAYRRAGHAHVRRQPADR